MFNKQPHQSFGVENEFIPASLLVPDDGVHASYLWCTLEDTQCLRKGMALVSRGQRGPRDTNILAYLTQNVPLYSREHLNITVGAGTCAGWELSAGYG